MVFFCPARWLNVEATRPVSLVLRLIPLSAVIKISLTASLFAFVLIANGYGEAPT